ncbi:YcnI family protein [Actinoplanes sp. NPDC049668]|uniref:YcnI family copper-binding membrane protein n=1 Tax=unclassified Actinoplanes TaxID=2626549 RepID=UPI00339FBFA8
MGFTWIRRLLLKGAAALIVSLAVPASAAGAHVSVTPSTTSAGAHAILQFSVGHGCEESPTTRITVQIPATITSVTPSRTALWKVEKRTEQVDPPVVDVHGNQIVERVAAVTFSTDTPLPDGYREVFELAVQLPDAAGTTLLFPTIQTCQQGEAAWIEVPQDGQNLAELALPAPGFTISGPVDGSHHHAAAAAPAATPAPKSDSLTLAALAAGVLGSVLGGVALLRQRRQA